MSLAMTPAAGFKIMADMGTTLTPPIHPCMAAILIAIKDLLFRIIREAYW